MPSALLVEDNPKTVEGYINFLQLKGWKTDLALGGSEALEKLKAAGYDAVVLDLQMSPMSGESTLEEIRQLPELSSLCVVILTGHPDHSSAVRTLRKGAYQYLQKPADPADLVQILRAGVAWHKAHAVRRKLLTAFSAEAVFGQIRQIIADTFQPQSLNVLIRRPDDSFARSLDGPVEELPTTYPDFISRLVAHRGPVFVRGRDIALHGWQPILPSAQCILAALILDVGGKVVGVIDLESKNADAFDGNWLDVVAYLADLAGLSLEIVNAEREQRKQLMDVARELRHHIASPAQVIQMQTEELKSKEAASLADEAKNSAIRRLNVIRDNADSIVRACDYLDDITRDVPLHKAEFDLTELLTTCAHEIQPEVSSKRIELSIRPAVSREVRVIADAQFLRYSAQCLLKNAVEAIEERHERALDPEGAGFQGQIDIDVDDSNPDQVTFSITDNGTGIPPDIQGSIFRPMFSTKRRPQQGGFGLFSVKRIVAKHKGNIHFVSKLNEATTFFVSIPRR